jgi:transcriptional regulator with GAF, ATPase, and Fis domain
MPLVAFSPSRPGTAEDLQPFEQLAVRMSARFSSLQANEAEEALTHALEEVGRTFVVDECTLVSYDGAGSAKVAGSWGLPPHPRCTNADIGRMPWLMQRVARNAVTAFTPTTDFCQAARVDGAQAARSGVVGRLAVPVVVGRRVVYGLMVGTRQRHGDWGGPIVERLRLVGEILGSGLARLHKNPGIGSAPQEPAIDCAIQGGAKHDETELDGTFARIIGDSVPLQQSRARIKRVAPLDTTVLLLGETGTGKELFAQAIHDSSRRRHNRLVRVNCAALPGSLIESELFGHERGAFTGAVSMRQGRFELAEGGTIFLDEIGDLSPELQAKLLRVLQEGEFERVGSSSTRRVDVRVIAATHVDLETAVADERFRADLYYRLSVFPVTLPPLRERPEDIPRLVWHFIERHQAMLPQKITSVPPEVMEALQQHDWPGNVRELENVIERAMIRTSDSTLQLDHPLRFGPRRGSSPGGPANNSDRLDDVQRSHIDRVLRECGGRINGAGNAAVRLGIHPNTLRFRIKKLGLARSARQAGAPAVTSAGRPG